MNNKLLIVASLAYDGIDTGEIIDQRIVKVLNTDNEKKLAKKILKEEHILYIKVIETLEKDINNGKVR